MSSERAARKVPEPESESQPDPNANAKSGADEYVLRYVLAACYGTLVQYCTSSTVVWLSISFGSRTTSRLGDGTVRNSEIGTC